MIEFRNVHKVYDNGSVALEDVSIHIEKGEFVLVCGHSGAGKSTFIKLLSHEVQPDSGTVMVNDVDVTRIKSSKVPYLRRKLGIVFQDFRLLPSKTVFENIAFALEVIEEKPKVIRAIVNTPLVLIADEPTGNLDPQTSRDISDLFKAINNSGTTVVMVTHDMDMVSYLNKRVIALEGGRVVSDQMRGAAFHEN